MAVGPEGAHVYATGGLDPTGDHDWIVIFDRDGITGDLLWLEALDHFTFCDVDVLAGFETDIVLHPDGERAFRAESSRRESRSPWGR